MSKTYTSHPIKRYGIGRFQFENGTLILEDEADIEEFEDVLKQLEKSAPAERNRIKSVDLAAAERISAEFQAKQGGATKGIDSATGERAGNQKPATDRLEDLNKAMENATSGEKPANPPAEKPAGLGLGLNKPA